MLNSTHAEKANEVRGPSGSAQFPHRAGLYYVKPVLEKFGVKPTKNNPTRMVGTVVQFEIQHENLEGKPDPDLCFEGSSAPMMIKNLSDWRQVNDLRQVTAFDKGERRSGAQGEDKYPDNEVGDWVFQEKVTEVPNLLKFISILKAFPLYEDQAESLVDEVIALQEECGVTQELINSKVIGEELSAFYDAFSVWYKGKLAAVATEAAEPGIMRIKIKPGSGNFGPSLSFTAYDYTPSAEKIAAGVDARRPWTPSEVAMINGVVAAEKVASKTSSAPAKESVPVDDDEGNYDD